MPPAQKLNARLKVNLTDSKSNIDEKLIRQAITAVVADHLKSRVQELSAADLVIDIVRCVGNDNLSQLSLELGGTINGQPISKRIRAKRVPQAARQAGGGVLGSMVTRAVGGAVSSVANKAFGDSSAAEPFRQCFEEAMADVAITLDKAMGVGESAPAELWKKFALARWIAAALLILLLALFSAGEKGFKGFVGGAVFGIMPAVAIFFLVHVIGLFIMPKEFFTDDPRGRKNLARAGVKTVGALRSLCVVLGFVLTLGLIIGVAIVVGMATKG